MSHRKLVSIDDYRKSARGAPQIFHIFDGALFGEGRLLERGAYFEIRNSDFSYAF